MNINHKTIKTTAVMMLALLIASLCIIGMTSTNDSLGDVSEPISSGDITYVFDTETNEITIKSVNKTATGTLIIPSTIDGKTVVAIGASAFQSASYSNIILPDTLETIDNYAFRYCNELKSLTIPDNVTTIGDSVIRECVSLKTVIFPSTLNSLGEYVLQGCTSLVSVTLPDNLTELPYHTFYGCTSLTSITIPDSIETIGSDAFYNCYSLKTINGGNGIVTIDTYAFAHCTSLVSYTLPDSVIYVKAGAFAYCSNLEEFCLGKLVSEFDANSIFYNNMKLAHITVSATNIHFFAVDNILYNNDSKSVAFVPYCVSGDVTITNGIISIPNELFRNRTAMTSITLQEGFKNLHDSAFVGCTSLVVANLPSTLETIGANVFNGCTSLLAIDLPDALTDIGSGAFYGCSSLESATIPSGLINVGNAMFYDCISLKDVTLDNGIEILYGSMFSGCVSLESITLPSTLTTIASYAFDRCTSLTEISLPIGITTIDNSAFSNCVSLTSISLPAGITVLKSELFAECSSLYDVTIPSSVKTIESNAFRDCVSLVSIDLPNELESVSGFKGCISLKTITIPSSVETIGLSAFEGCTSLLSVEMTSISGVIGYNAFMDCVSLHKITIPEGVTTIGEASFMNCTNLVEIDLPSTLTRIERNAFKNCDALMQLTIPENLNYVGQDAFNGCRIRVLINNSNISSSTFTSSYIGKVIDATYPEGNYYDYEIFELIEKDGFLYAKYSKTYDSVVKYQLLSFVGDYTDETWAVLPSTTIEGVTWTSLYLRGLIDVKLPSGADYRNLESLFSGSKSLRTAECEEGFIGIPSYCFDQCIRLNSIYLPASIAYVGSSAFNKCTNLENVIFDENSTIATLGDYLFYYCNSLTNVVLPVSLTSISNYMFSDCTSLEEIDILENVTTIGSRAFYNSGLTHITIPKNVKTIGSEAFRVCSNLESVIFAENSELTTISDNVFNSTGLVEVELPSSLTSIGSSAFSNCLNLVRINIPVGVTTINEDVFYKNESLVDLIFDSNENITTIGNYAFYGCESLLSIEFTNVTSIGNYAFYGCSKLSEAILSEGLTTIGNNAFNKCNLLMITLYGNITSIGTAAFNDNSSFFTIVGEAGSYAETYAFNNRIPFVLIEGMISTRLVVNFEFDGTNPYTGLMLKIVGETDGFTYSRAISGAETSILGLTDKQKYTVMVVSQSGSMFSKVEGVEFTDGEASCTLNTTIQRMNLSLIVKNSDDEIINDGYSVVWKYNDIMVGSSNELKDVASGTEYQCIVVLDRSLLNSYKQPEIKNVTVNGNDLIIVLEDVNYISVDYDITIESVPSTTSTMLLKYIFNGNSYVISVVSDNGTYHADVPEGCDISVSIFDPSCHDYVESINNVLVDISRSISIEKINEAMEISLSIIEHLAVEVGENLQNGNIYDYSIQIINTTNGTTIETPTVRNGKLYLKTADASYGDNLSIYVTDVRGMFLSASKSITFNDSNNVVIDVIEFGGIRIVRSDVNNADVALLFDDDGLFVKKIIMSTEDTFRNIPQGMYMMVMSRQYFLADVPSLSSLAEFGFVEGDDYAIVDVEIENGLIKTVECNAPPITSQPTIHFDTAETSLILNKPVISIGENVMLRVKYSFTQDSLSLARDVKLKIIIPYGLTYQENSLISGDGRVLSSTIEDNIIEISMGDDSTGIVLMNLRGNGYSNHVSISGIISYNNGVYYNSQPIGSAELSITEMLLQVPESTSVPDVYVIGRTAPNTSVDLYVDGVYKTSTTSNATGVFTTWVRISQNPVMDQAYGIKAIASFEDGGIAESPMEYVVYTDAAVSAVSVTMTALSNLHVDYNNPPGYVPTYSYTYPSTISFAVYLEVDNPNKVSNVKVSLGFNLGQMKDVSCVYNSTLNCWIGKIYCQSLNDAPLSIVVCYTDSTGEKRTFDQPIKYILDPSGTVYEGVLSNPLEGVKTTLYQKVTIGGIEYIIEWKADEYGQMNPLFTDVAGYYEWYVPDGLWMVKYEKEGYLTSYSDWMEVPPPRTDVNVGMISTAFPTVSSVTVYEEFIDIVFSQYMNVNSVSGTNVSITIGGVVVNGTITPIDAESSPDMIATTLAKMFRFTPDSTTITGLVNIAIKNTVNYAGNAQQNEYNTQITVEPYPNSIIVENDKAGLNNETNIVIRLDVSVSGKIIDVMETNPFLLSVLTHSVVTDSDGKAVVKVKGYMEGETEIVCVLRDTLLSSTITLTVEDMGDEPGGDDTGGDTGGDDTGGDEPVPSVDNGNEKGFPVAIVAVVAIVILAAIGFVVFHFVIGKKP